MCCDSGNDFKYSDINGSCEKCGSPTVNGEALEVLITQALIVMLVVQHHAMILVERK